MVWPSSSSRTLRLRRDAGSFRWWRPRPKPRLVKLVVASAGEDRLSIGGSPRKATHFIVKIEIGGIAGVVAPLIGKQPPDSHVWILEGEAPAFVRSEGPLAMDGPVWRIELVSPVWP